MVPNRAVLEAVVMRGCRPLIRSVLSAACLTVLGFPVSGSAQTLQSCLIKQIDYSGTGYRGMGRCYVKAMRRGVVVDPGCLSQRDAETESRYNSVESNGTCLVEPAGTMVTSMMDATITLQAAAITPTSGKCGAGKMGAIGKEFKQLTRCYSDAVHESVPLDPGCLSAASGKLVSVFDRLETRYGAACDTVGDAAARDAQNLFLAFVVYSNLIDPLTTTTTSTTTSTSTSTLPVGPSCPEDGSFTPCVAYRDNPACTTCVDAAGGIAASQCIGAGPICADSYNNQGCAFAINTATTCGATCCPP